MAIDILSIPSMSAESERVFSGARRTITWERHRLGADVVEQSECLKSWIKLLMKDGEAMSSKLAREVLKAGEEGVVDDDVVIEELEQLLGLGSPSDEEDA
jgi:predicted transport protein